MVAQAPGMLDGSYPLSGALKHLQKDVRLALQTARQQGLSLPVAAASNDLFLQVGRLRNPILRPQAISRLYMHWKCSAEAEG